MEQQIAFLNKLNQLKELSDGQAEELKQEQILEFFSGMDLSEEQINMIAAYIKERKGPGKRAQLTEQEQEYLDLYSEGISEEGVGTVPECYLATVVRVAQQYAGRGVSLEDLIQEGNMGLVMAEQLLAGQTDQKLQKELAEREIRKSLLAAVDEQEYRKSADDKMVHRINELVDRMKELAEELGYKPSIDEVSHFLDMETKEIKELLFLAGEEIETTETPKE